MQKDEMRRDEINIWHNAKHLNFMQNKTHPHLAIAVCECQNAQSHRKQMQHRGSNKWPARNLDLTLCDFFLWC